MSHKSKMLGLVLPPLLLLLLLQGAEGGAESAPRCTCVSSTSERISPRLFRRLEILPPSFSCAKTQLIVDLANSLQICLDPQAPWVRKYLSRVLLQRSKANHGTTSTTSSSEP
ncbi:alveolar macrophage chemotactic factor-like [Petromyzon marinus]|uniref:Alveolar macrophage chemotactic factor-like n=1 Tax=Petromyzon marinus TaxID=7757 RepID=A0AAJ7UHP9_PETMA|nr:alveolar macrophage chemotactic factor-like [Petromyzon marinus]